MEAETRQLIRGLRRLQVYKPFGDFVAVRGDVFEALNQCFDSDDIHRRGRELRFRLVGILADDEGLSRETLLAWAEGVPDGNLKGVEG